MLIYHIHMHVVATLEFQGLFRVKPFSRRVVESFAAMPACLDFLLVGLTGVLLGGSRGRPNRKSMQPCQERRNVTPTYYCRLDMYGDIVI